VFASVLVANRGEIAVRILRTLRALGIRSVAVYSDADQDAPHTRLADEAIRIGPAAPAASYLHIERVIGAARAGGADAIHPGYGFLSESAAFARACADAGVVFVGPPAAAIETMGDKIRAKRAVESAGVPVVAGVHEPGLDDDALAAAATGVGYPLMVKAAAGGGGKGMRVVHHPSDLAAGLAAARREARGAFGDDALLLERFVERPRHIEIQVLADQHGAAVHFGERECSLQRRHQKIVEEAPSPLLDDVTRKRMGAAAVDAARACAYAGAGTVEFLVGAQQPDEFFFLEMNTRLQVEHPVTEVVYGVDLVECQLRVAAGERLGFAQDDLRPTGHAVEARVYAEDPARGFLPTGGRVLRYREPPAPGVRVDSGVQAGSAVTAEYDPMLAKVIGSGADRGAALDRLDHGLRGLVVLGVQTNVAFLRALIADHDVRAGRVDTGLVEARLADFVDTTVPDDVFMAAGLAYLRSLEPPDGAAGPWAVPGGWRIGQHAWTSLRLRAGAALVDVHLRGRGHAAEVRLGDGPARAASAAFDGEDLVISLDGRTRRYAYVEDGHVAWIGRDGAAWALWEEAGLDAARHADERAVAGPVTAPMPGMVTVVYVGVGEAVRRGQPLLVVEAMKMEHPIPAPVDGTVARIDVIAGEQVAMEQPLVMIEPAPGAAS
jgi:acetyl-CoA/propionyl-CoA carboxylase, biotin carboxylase, biotin carboxyl carrier protein